MPIDNQIKVSEDIKHTTIPKQQSNRESTSAVLASNNKTSVNLLTSETSETTSETGKHGVIYDTKSNSSSEHEDMKILLLVSGILAGLGYMYFKI